jgi:regulator of RNase E activity RraB
MCIRWLLYFGTVPKAEKLSSELEKLSYHVKVGNIDGCKPLFIIKGWTHEMKPESDLIEKWVESMCDLGYIFDCDFDGWGAEV